MSLQPPQQMRTKAPVRVQPPPKPKETVESVARDDQPPLSMLAPEEPGEALPDAPLQEDRTALPLLDYYRSREGDNRQGRRERCWVYPRRHSVAFQVVKFRLYIEFGTLVGPKVARSPEFSRKPRCKLHECAVPARKGDSGFEPTYRANHVRSTAITARSSSTLALTIVIKTF